MLFSNKWAETPVQLKLKTQTELLSDTESLRQQLLLMETTVTQAGSLQNEWVLPGWCEVCEHPAFFSIDWLYSDQQTPNYRERLICPSCGLNNRQRFVLAWIKKEVIRRAPFSLRIYLYEQVTPFFQAAQKHLKGHPLTGSEYLGFDKCSGETINGIRHEDAMALSFADNSMDLIISNDVLEHVPDYRRALAESARVLTSGGRLVFSIPFYPQAELSRPRAILENGTLRHVLPEQYHGNPVSEKGSLVFHDFGWDVLADCRSAGFSEAYVLFYYSLPHGYLGNGGQIIFMAEKKGPENR